jgi:exopolysaccharide production protein ExoZ
MIANPSEGNSRSEAVLAPVKARHRDADLDVFRGIAILLILILHAGMLTPDIDAHPYVRLLSLRSAVGVQLFVLLSGFLICRSWESVQGARAGLRAFALKRVAKIYPLYFLFLHLNILAFLILRAYVPRYVSPFNSVSAENLTWGNYFAHLTFTQIFVPGGIHSLLDGSWTIICVVYFYILFPVIHRWTSTLHGAIRTYIYSLAVVAVLSALVGGRFSNLFFYSPIAQLPCFLLGIICYRATSSAPVRSLVEHNASLMLFFSLVLMAGMVAGDAIPLGSYQLYGICMALIIVAVRASERWRSLFSKGQWLMLLGRHSYALFFTHIFLLKLTFYFGANSDLRNHFWLLLIISFAAAIPLSLLLSMAIVSPIERFFVGSAWRRAGALTSSAALEAP